MLAALFFGFAALLVVTSLMVVLHKNPVTSALFLVLAFCSLAGIYLLLKAEFLGMVQIVVYAGAIMVLFLFVIMYLNLQHDVETGVRIAVRRGIGWFVGAALLLTGATLLKRGWALGPGNEALPGAENGNVAAIGRSLYSRYLFHEQQDGRDRDRARPGPSGRRAPPAAGRGRCERGRAMIPLSWLIALSAIVFTIGVVGVLVRRNALVIFMSVELMLNAANLAFVAFASQLKSLDGQIFVFFVMTVAAAEVAIGLAIIVHLFRLRETVFVDEIHLLKG